MTNEISFEIPNTPENVRAFEELRKESEKYPFTLYAEDGSGNIVPIADITKHPDCPSELFQAFLQSML